MPYDLNDQISSPEFKLSRKREREVSSEPALPPKLLVRAYLCLPISHDVALHSQDIDSHACREGQTTHRKYHT